MHKEEKKFPAKLLLFGEYGVLFGLQGLAIPYFPYSGYFIFKNAQRDNRLLKWHKHLESIGFDEYLHLNAFGEDIKRGLHFLSTIPLNSGLGSSGALVAATYYRFKISSEEFSLSTTKNILAAMESYFHGNSSGVDPLVSYLQKPVLVKGEQVKLVEEEMSLELNNKYTFSIINSGLEGKSDDLISAFMQKLSNQFTKRRFLEAYINFSDNAIDYLIEKEYDAMEQCYRQLSEFQLEFMEELIPLAVKEEFNRGLKTNNSLLKILGSGGGGHFLCLTKNDN